MSAIKRFLLIVTLAAIAAPALAQTAKPYAIDYYYKVQWGHADEFLSLFKKNHYPLLKKEIEMGRILRVTMDKPAYHMPEAERWDYRVTIVFKDLAAAADDSQSERLTRELFPDQDTFKREEQRRFEILLAHWDLPITAIDLEKKDMEKK